jgi:hypothetical protein
MILRELFNMSDSGRNVNDLRYNPSRDQSVMRKSDTRKTRLTLSQINELRKGSEAHILEQENELAFINKMYAKPPVPAPA